MRNRHDDALYGALACNFVQRLPFTQIHDSFCPLELVFPDFQDVSVWKCISDFNSFSFNARLLALATTINCKEIKSSRWITRTAKKSSGATGFASIHARLSIEIVQQWDHVMNLKNRWFRCQLKERVRHSRWLKTFGNFLVNFTEFRGCGLIGEPSHIQSS